MTEIAKVIGEKWKALSDKERVPFIEEAQRLKDEYHEEMDKYMETEEYKAYRVKLEEWEKEYGKKASKSRRNSLEEEVYAESVSDGNARFLFGPRFREKMSNKMNPLQSRVEV